MAETIYFNSFSAKRSKYGIKLSGKVDKIIEELQKNVNAKGYINLEITERKSEGKYGETHSVKVDKWEPSSSHGTTTRDGITTQNDDLPF